MSMYNDMLLRTVISVNQLSVYGAIADSCNEVPKDLGAPGEPAALIWKRWKCLPTSTLQKILPLHSSGKPGARIRAKSRTIVRRPEIIQTMF